MIACHICGDDLSSLTECETCCEPICAGDVETQLVQVGSEWVEERIYIESDCQHEHEEWHRSEDDAEAEHRGAMEAGASERALRLTGMEIG